MPAAPLPDAVMIIEQDELFTFIGEKNEIDMMTLVGRATSCIAGRYAGYEQTDAVMQAIVEAAS